MYKPQGIRLSRLFAGEKYQLNKINTKKTVEIFLSGKRSIWELVAGVIFAAVIIGIILFIRKKNP